MAGERTGSGRQQGLYGKVSVYRTGKGAVSGFGEAVLARGLADPGWSKPSSTTSAPHGHQRARDWARDAIARLALEVAWATCVEAADARHRENQVVALLRPYGLWNR